MPKFNQKPYKLIKYGGALKTKTTRFFLIDEKNILYFTKESNRVAKGIKSLDGAKARWESRSKMTNGTKWADSDNQFRVIICLKGKEKKPVYVYSNDLHFCKALVVKIKLVANPLFLIYLVTGVQQASRIHRLKQFCGFWDFMKKAY